MKLLESTYLPVDLAIKWFKFKRIEGDNWMDVMNFPGCDEIKMKLVSKSLEKGLI